MWYRIGERNRKKRSRPFIQSSSMRYAEAYSHSKNDACSESDLDKADSGIDSSSMQWSRSTRGEKRSTIVAVGYRNDIVQGHRVTAINT